MDTAKTPVGSLTTLAIIEPSGKRRVLGRIFEHSNPLLQALIGTPLRWQLDYNTGRHNRRMKELAR